MVFERKTFFVLLPIFILLCSFLISTNVKAATCDSDLEGKTDQELQAISDQCDKEIAEQKVILENTQKYSSELEKGVAELTYKINTSLLQIKAKNAKIKQLGESIVSKSEYIGELSDRMDNIRRSIAKMIRSTYGTDNTSVIEMLLSNESLSTFFKDVDEYASINVKLQELIVELIGVKKTSEEQKKDLETKQKLEEKLKFEQEAEKKLSESYKKEKQSILTITKGQEDLYKKTIAEKERLKNQIRNRLFRTASGEEISFGDALKIVQPYESTIGVSSALILAVLFQESAVNSTIGANIGKCTYNQANVCGLAGKTVMSDAQKPFYLDIMSKLELNADKTPVSCPICRDGNYGGAMGPSQFMPETWTGVMKRVSSIINIAYPSPFKNLDAFVAAGVLLKDNQNRCKTAYSKNYDIWACSAAKYYGGLMLRDSKLATSMRYGYGKQVADRAVQFQKDIDTLNL